MSATKQSLYYAVAIEALQAANRNGLFAMSRGEAFTTLNLTRINGVK
jgi:hypothetical protein